MTASYRALLAVEIVSTSSWYVLGGQIYCIKGFRFAVYVSCSCLSFEPSNPYFQCKQCNFFEMLNDEQAAAVGFFFPANGALQQQLPPMQSIGLGPQALQAFPLPRMDPRYNPAPSEHFSWSTPLPAAAVGSAKHHCSMSRCKRVAAEACGLCKSCCGDRGQGCTTRTHRTAPPSKVHVTSFTPARPPAVLPPLPSVSTLTQLTSTPATAPSSAVAAGPRSFREDMSDEWLKEWNDRERKAKERREADELKRKNEQAMARQVVVRVWREVCPFLCIFPTP